ncbi:cytochrome c oxidase assembly protein subunit 15 [Crossiella equi]|uniref:Cytochrome c oxidase assembly protein subunit 15 n=1 Tax=Crossiella equi TaxID=130796 RepID=A0ABS5AP23_9PSEU|nr:COX15/CtaA family protein [Crossiella equi]MBP2478328.1 cytochrome c oxidase assembly protein subunit 15 [Crossiella equi]
MPPTTVEPASPALPARAPSAALTRAVLVVNLVLQVVIAVTGSVVRVTGSGLGCPTWPNCFPGSLVPIEHPDFAWFHQWIEFGNRLLSGVVGLVALACFVLAWLHRPRRRRLTRLALATLLVTISQGVIGGITVLFGLVWWTVAGHFLVSMVLVWLAVLLVRAPAESDDPVRPLLPGALRQLLVVATVVLGGVLAVGTMVTGAGPHAGDAATKRLDLSVSALAQAHADLLFLYLGLLIAFGFALRAVAAGRPLWRAFWWLVAVVLAQGGLGMVQYAIGVPEVLVSFHVLGAALVTLAMANMWAATGDRGLAVPAGDQRGLAEDHLAGSSATSVASQR